MLIFQIKDQVGQPLIGGLHSSFVGLDDATIDWTIPVRDNIPIVLDIPLDTDTTVVLTAPVPLVITADITFPGVGVLNNARINLALPEGLELPVHLNMNVPVDQDLDIALDVRAVIPIEQTQLHDPIENLRLLFEPLTFALTNLPDGFGDVRPFVADVLDGTAPDLLDGEGLRPWPGFSTTAGVDYELLALSGPFGTRPTGIVPIGGIPVLDEEIRPELYADPDGPAAVNEQSLLALQSQPFDAYHYDGSMGAFFEQETAGTDFTQAQMQVGEAAPAVVEPGVEGDGDDLGIIPPASSEGGG